MDPKPLEDFLPDLNILVDGVPRVFMLGALRQTCIEFCQQTLLLREKLAILPISANVDEYELEPSLCDSEVCRVLNVWVNGTLISPTTPDIGVRAAGLYQSDLPSAYYCTEPSVLRLVPMPTAAAVLEVEVAYAPASDADNVPMALYTMHREDIVRGAAARLLIMPKRPWTDMTAGKVYRNLFWHHMHSVARSDHWSGYGRPVHVASSKFL